MEISDYIKAESQKNVIYYLLPGLISFWPFAMIMYKYADMGAGFKLSDYLVYISVAFAILSMGFGTLVEDLACRMEMWLEKVVQHYQQIEPEHFEKMWNNYLLLKIKKNNEVTLNRYYRAMLLRLRFELHTLIAVCIMLFGHLMLTLLYPGNIDCGRTLLYIVCFLVLCGYLFYEAYNGVSQLHKLREKMCEDVDCHSSFYTGTVKEEQE